MSCISCGCTLSKEDNAERLARMARELEADLHLSSFLTGIAESLGGHMDGLDTKFKSLEHIRAKLARGDVVRDALRFTMVFPLAMYTASTTAALRILQPWVTHVRNRWPLGDGYQGINVNLRTDGAPWELQFHDCRRFVGAILDLVLGMDDGSVHDVVYCISNCGCLS